MRRATRIAAVAVTLATTLGAGACSRETEFAGIGPWHVKKTTLAQATGRCQPTELPDGRQGTWCFGQPGLRIGGQDASIDLYFGGVEPSSKVIEIQLQFRGCKEELLEAWVRKNFGEPYDQRGKRWFVKNSAAFLVADLPGSPGRCTLRLLPRSEDAEVARLQAERPASPRPPPSTP